MVEAIIPRTDNPINFQIARMGLSDVYSNVEEHPSGAHLILLDPAKVAVKPFNQSFLRRLDPDTVVIGYPKYLHDINDTFEIEERVVNTRDLILYAQLANDLSRNLVNRLDADNIPLKDVSVAVIGSVPKGAASLTADRNGSDVDLVLDVDESRFEQLVRSVVTVVNEEKQSYRETIRQLFSRYFPKKTLPDGFDLSIYSWKTIDGEKWVTQVYTLVFN